MATESKKSSGKKRIPRLFPLAMPEQRFRRRILRRIPLRSEREWLESLYVADDGSEYVRRTEEVGAGDIKRLRRLAKAVKHNRGFLQPVKLGLLGTIAAIVLIFVLVFAAPLASNAIERGLEHVFGARADLEGFSLRYREPGFAFERLTVANRAQPMENLFEMDGGEVRLDLGQLIRGRAVVRNAEVRDVAFGTERSSSGALPPERRPSDDDEAGPNARQQLSALFSDVSGEVEGMVSGIDARRIVEAELSALETPVIVEREVERIEALIDEWESRVQSAVEGSRQLRGDVETLAALDPGSIESLAALRDARERARRVTEGSQELYERGREGMSAAQEMEGRFRSSVDRVRESVERDAAYIRERIPDPETVLRAPFAGPVAAVVVEHVEPYLERAQVAMDAYERLQALQERLAPDDVAADPTPQRGRDLVFPSREYPRFLLERAAVSVLEVDVRYGGRLTDVSSDPELSNAPSQGVFEWSTDGGQGGIVQTRVDLRRQANPRVGIDVNLHNQHIAISLAAAGVIPIDEIASDYNLESAITVTPEGDVGVEATMFLPEPTIEFAVSNELTRRTHAVLERTGTVEVSLSFPAAGSLPVSTNLDEALAAEIDAFIRELRENAVEEAERLVRERFAEEIREVQRYVEEAERTVELARRRYDELVHLYERAEGERERIERRIAELQAEVEQRARDEAERAARDAEERARREVDESLRDAEQGLRDALDGFRGR